MRPRGPFVALDQFLWPLIVVLLCMIYFVYSSYSYLKWMWPAHIISMIILLSSYSYTVYEMELQLLIIEMMCSFETAGLMD